MGYKKVSEEFKMNVVRDLLSQDLPNLNATARKYDMSPSSVAVWKRKYANSSSMKKSKKIESLTPEEKLEIVMKTYSMSDQELGEFLRSNGLHSSDLVCIKKECLPSTNSKGRPKLDPELVELRKKVKALNSNLKKKDAALAEYSARVILLKKSHEIWGTDEDD